MTEQVKGKAKRKLKGFDFSKDGAALALVGPSVGGPANGIPTLIAKANNFSPEFIQKMQTVQVTMELPEFLERFFGLYGSDGEVLARLMGYVKPEVEYDSDDWWENYIEEKLSAFTILKSLNESENLPEALSKLTENDYMDVLNDQVVIEKAMKELAEGSSDPKVDTSTKNVEKQVEASASKVNKNKGKQMTQATDMVEKSELIAVQKAAEAKQVELEKALETIAKFEEARKQAVIKSKTEAIQAVVKDEKQAAVIVKAALALDNEEDFQALVEVFKAQNEMIEKSDAFRELGASADAAEQKPEESGLVKAIKAKYQAK